MSKNTALVLAGGALLLLLVGIGVIMQLVKQPQQLSKPQAAVPGGTATLSLTGPSSVTSGTALPVTINVSAPTTPGDRGIIGIKAVLTTDNAYLSLADTDISPQLLSPWIYATKSVSTSGSTLTITVEAMYLQPGATGFTGASSAVPFAALNFSTQGNGTIQMNFNTSVSEIRTKEDNQDILSNQLSGTTFIVGAGGGNPTPYPTPTPTGGTGGADVSTPTPGPTNACGGTCGSDSNCNSGLTCYSGYCRNPSCVTATNCSCPGATPTPTPTRRPTPTSTPEIVDFIYPTSVVFPTLPPTPIPATPTTIPPRPSLLSQLVLPVILTLIGLVSIILLAKKWIHRRSPPPPPPGSPPPPLPPYP